MKFVIYAAIGLILTQSFLYTYKSGQDSGFMLGTKFTLDVLEDSVENFCTNRGFKK